MKSSGGFSPPPRSTLYWRASRSRAEKFRHKYMGVTVDWANDSKTILCYTFAGSWDWDAFYVCWDWVRDALEVSDHKISVILDFQATRHIPPNSLVHLRSLSQNVHPNY